MTLGRRALGGAALAAIAAAAAIPALTGAQPSGPRDIIAREKVRTVKFVRAKPSTRGDRLDQGDRVITRQALFNQSDRAIGTLFTDCVNVGSATQVFKATLQCAATYRFSDGQVASAGVVRLSSARGARFPIVGGSGAYSSARGEVEAAAPVKGYDTVDVLHLAG